MHCILCLEERPESLEHVFPEAVGGAFTIDRVCKPCNDKLGSGPDSELVNTYVMDLARAAHGIKGKSRKVPNPFGIGELPSGLRVNVSFDHEKGAAFRLLPQSAKADDGSVRMTVDPTDAPDIIAKRVARERAQAGLPAYTEEEMRVLVTRMIETAERGSTDAAVKFSPTIHLTGFERGLLKIAYELAWYWLGDAYLEDAHASKLRACLLADRGVEPLPPTCKGIQGIATIGSGDDGALAPWRDDATSLLAFAQRVRDSVWVGVRILKATTQRSRSARTRPVTPCSPHPKPMASLSPMTPSRDECAIPRSPRNSCVSTKVEAACEAPRASQTIKLGVCLCRVDALSCGH